MSDNHEGTIARIAGNLMSGVPNNWMMEQRRERTVEMAVLTARMIVAEVYRTKLKSSRPMNIGQLDKS